MAINKLNLKDGDIVTEDNFKTIDDNFSELNTNKAEILSTLDDHTTQLNDMKYYITPQMFGAVGNGVTDDTTALNSAFTSSEFKNIYLPPGTYMVTGNIGITSNKKIVGSGTSTIIKLIANSGDTNVINSADILENITIKDLVIDGFKEDYENPSAHTTCLNLSNVNNLNLNNLYIINSLIEGCYLYKCSNVNISDFYCYYNGFKQADASGCHIDTCDNVNINNLISHNNGFHGLILSNSSFGNYNNIICYSNGYDGIRVQYASNYNSFSNVKCNDNMRGIYFTTESSYNVVNTGIFNYNSANAINSNVCYENVVSNSYGVDNAGVGVCLVDATDKLILSNVIFKDNKSGEQDCVEGSTLIIK